MTRINGALSREQCLELKNDPKARNRTIWYVVPWCDKPTKSTVHALAMTLKPPIRYFENFWLAYAYSCKLNQDPKWQE